MPRRCSFVRSGAGAALSCAVLAGAAPAAEFDPAPGVTTPDVALRAAQQSKLSHRALRALSPQGRVSVADLPMPVGGPVTLDLERFEIAAADAQLIVVDEHGAERPLDTGNLVLLRGTIAGEPGARVFVGVSDFGTNGWIQRDGTLYSISTGRAREASPDELELRVTDATEIAFAQTPGCAVEPVNQRFAELAQNMVTNVKSAGDASEVDRDPRGGAPCRIVDVAVETDWEFTANLFGGNANASGSYALLLMAAVSEIYQSDLNVRLRVPFLRTWAADNDPYNASDDPLDQVMAHWNSQMGGVSRTIVHRLSARTNTPYGGVAYLSVLCNQDFGYGYSGYLGGSFPYPLQDFNGGNWDLMVTAHELGHNFSSVHTHDYSPPLDRCGIDCTGNVISGMMSYCHGCAGGLTNVYLGFNPEIIPDVLSYMDSIAGGCDLTPDGVASAQDDTAQTLETAPVTIDALANDSTGDCSGAFPSIVSFQNATPGGGSVQLINIPSTLRQGFRYTAGAGFSGTDTFTYTVSGGDVGTVTIDVLTYRAAENPTDTVAGARVFYYELSPSIAFLPDFDALTAYADGIVANINVPSTGGVFSTSGRADQIGAVYEGYVNVPSDGLYTFYTNSDDGSRLFIGDTLVVDNDGLHGMVERGGQIALRAGRHTTRVEFFENGGGAGLIVSYQSPTLSKRVVPASAWTTNDPCPLDLTSDGQLDSGDLNVFIIFFLGGHPTADLTGDGQVDSGDLIVFIEGFLAGC
jgi:hypothetical protein